jgi:hypothetical protein
MAKKLIDVGENAVNALAREPIDYIRAWWSENSTEAERTEADERGATIEGAMKFVEDFIKRGKNNGMACLPDAITYEIVGIFMRNCVDGDEYATAEEIAEEEKREANRIKAEAERKERLAEAKRKAEQERIEMIRKARSWARRKVNELLAKGKIHPRFKVVIPSTETELVAEGDAMHNCIGHNYVRSWQNGNCELAFIRKDGKPYIDLCVVDGKIDEVRYDRNKAVNSNSADYKLCKKIAKLFKSAA